MHLYYVYAQTLAVSVQAGKEGMQSVATYISLHGSSAVLKEAFSAQQSPVGLGLASGFFHI